MDIAAVIETIMRQIKETARAETVIGAAVQSGESVIVPVSKVSFGFGIGGGKDNNQKKGSGLGAGVGASVEPVAFVVVTGGKAKLLSLKSREATFANLIEMIPSVLESLRKIIAGRRKEEPCPSDSVVQEGLKG